MSHVWIPDGRIYSWLLLEFRVKVSGFRVKSQALIVTPVFGTIGLSIRLDSVMREYVLSSKRAFPLSNTIAIT